MKKLHLIFAALGLVFIFNACAPEEVQPQADPEKMEKFEVKSDGEDGSVPSKPNPK